MASRRFFRFMLENSLLAIKQRNVRNVHGNTSHRLRTAISGRMGNLRILPKVKQFATLALIPTVSAFGFSKKKSEDKPVSVQFLSEDQQFIQKCDTLYDDNEIEELYNLLLPRSGTGNDEILWRLARAACEYGKQLGGESKKEHIYEAYRYIKLALDINEKNFAVHKWYAILLDLISEYEGTKQRITNAYKVRDHLERAIELNPKDATTIHSLGVCGSWFLQHELVDVGKNSLENEAERSG
ncbi:hypothetical protein LSH36_35g02003 [Paralvinella palmiformis]|uniref:Regulator of microtubule dynamics protein 1 n=1 Tax=Paralvinella palmiformis TaxID=53620 RepID=A0AAD9K932_9ANNE|nr:hypothetical protein LSH36_35g02003 [Paralvinella palmiformis]